MMQHGYNRGVIDWLLDGDPAIRWQVLCDLTDAAPDEVAAERARVEHEGWGARLLALEGADGLWDGGACFPAAYTGGEAGQPWTATMHTLQTLQIFGLDPASKTALSAISQVAQHGRWEHAGQRYFDGEVEPCINGRTIETGAYFGVDVAPIVERILGEQLEDGGWNCEVENGSVRSSFHTTIDVLDGLLEFERWRGLPTRCDELAVTVRSTCSSAACSVARAAVRSPIQRSSTSRSRTTGATTYCEHSTTSDGHALTRTPGWQRASTSCSPSGSPTADGYSTAFIQVVSISKSRAASERPAAGTRSARSGCSSGGTSTLNHRWIGAEDRLQAHVHAGPKASAKASSACSTTSDSAGWIHTWPVASSSTVLPRCMPCTNNCTSIEAW